VNPQLVWNVRRALDAEGFGEVRIIASGGFTVEKIEMFERECVPVDAYGVGSSLFQGRFDFTADVVRIDGRPVSKVGREYRPNPRLELVR
jgi:nicotinate phosphoribosyltransferase